MDILTFKLLVATVSKCVSEVYINFTAVRQEDVRALRKPTGVRE